jgi:DNA-directed RNA polymerase subunit A'
MNDSYTADVEKVTRVQFSLLSPDDIRNRSVVEVTKDRIYNGSGVPCPGGLFDRKMGVLESGVVCTTDDLDKQDCPGFFGHIELAMPVFYVQFITWIKGVLESICFRCGALRVNRELRKKELDVIRATAKRSTRYSMLIKLIKANRNNCMYCPMCNARTSTPTRRKTCSSLPNGRATSKTRPRPRFSTAGC